MPKGIRNIEISVGEHNLTHFGGIILIHRFCKKLKLRWLLQKKVRITRRLGIYHPVDLILAIIYALIVGIPRLKRTKILQGNGAFQRIVGLSSFPYASSLQRFLKSVDEEVLQGINKVHDHTRREMFYHPRPRTSLVFDFDSTVLTIYGKAIEKAEVGYNPKRKGARSYHPLLCFEYNTKDFWHGILRPGNVYTSAGGKEFLNACLEKVPPYVYRIRVRADSGFFDKEFIEPLDEKRIGYAIVAKMTRKIKGKLEGLRYRRLKGNWSVAEFQYTPWQWKEPHRFVIIRRPIKEKDSEQLALFQMKRYAYQVLVTNLSLKPEKVWRFYRKRASIEIIIKELKENLALAKIPTKNFLANQMFFHLLLFAYNIVNWFRRTCLPKRYRHSTLQTLRDELLVLPARLIKAKHRNILKLPAEYISKKELEAIVHRIERLSYP